MPFLIDALMYLPFDSSGLRKGIFLGTLAIGFGVPSDGSTLAYLLTEGTS
jgi:hypothetical protein